MPPLVRRRSLFLPAGAALASALLPRPPASAQQGGGRPRGGGRQGGASQASGAPAARATTPLGPIDTGARQAFVIDYDTDAVLLEKNAGRADAALLHVEADDHVHGLRPAEAGAAQARSGVAGERARLAHGRQQDVRAGRHHRAGRGADPRRGRAVGQRRLRGVRGGDLGVRAAIRRRHEREGAGDRPRLLAPSATRPAGPTRSTAPPAATSRGWPSASSPISRSTTPTTTSAASAGTTSPRRTATRRSRACPAPTASRPGTRRRRATA